MQQTQLSSYNNDWYNPGASYLKRVIWYIINILFFMSYLPFSGIRVMLLRLFGAKVGKGVVIKPSVNIKYPWKLEIGNDVWIGEKVWIDNLEKVMIGNNACISQGAMLLCGNHNYKKSTFDLITRGIHLKDGVWIGAQAVVCPGIVCHSHSVLAVGSVAVTNLEEYSIYQGNPAVKVRDRVIKQ
jgi:putative colanic acid biosynthesis acetyltransferase WcaF